jgi:predicted acyl esterase
MNEISSVITRSEVRDGMRIDWNVAIPMDDGIVLRADVYRPIVEDRYPVIMSHGPYGKGVAFQEGYSAAWEKMAREHSDVTAGSSNKYQNWEVVDPEKWIPDGYVVVRVDSRGAGWSPGFLDLWSPRETHDFAACIEWAALQPWSTGKIGLSGISYYAINQWQVSALKPPHLAAMVAWEGAADFYRDLSRHGGILCQFVARWYPIQISTVQHGVGERSRKNPNTGEPVAGPVTLSAEELAGNRADLVSDVATRSLDCEWYQARSVDWSRVETPFLSAANWGGQGLHPRGNFEAFTQAASAQKWLEVHGLEHWTHLYTDYGVDLQKRFFGYFLKGIETGWREQPRVLLQVRHVDKFVERRENEWPLARTRWTKFYLDASSLGLGDASPALEAKAEYDAFGDGLSFSTEPLARETEITGPIAVRLFVSSSTEDADLFVVVRVFGPDNNEVVFQGALDPNTPIAQGWLRVSHRRLDPKRSLPYRPYHLHDRAEPMVPGQVYEVEVEVWPTCIVVPAGYRIVLTVRGKDYEYGGELSEFARNFHYASKGCGPFLHDDPQDRPKEKFGGRVALYSGGKQAAYLLLPVIPS